MGAFSANFSTTPSGKTMDGTQKSIGPKMMALCFLFVTLQGLRLLWCVVDLLPEDIASTFVGRFRCHLHRFLRKKSIFQPIEQFWKFSLGGATIGARMTEKTFKIWENGCKVCAHHFDHCVARWLPGRASDLCIADTGFDSRPGRCRVRTLGKFLTPMCNVVLYNHII